MIRPLDTAQELTGGSYANFRVEISSIGDAVKAKTEFREIIDKWNDLFKKGLVKGDSRGIHAIH